jgi:release factor glutamine methyltransferase
MDEARRAAAYEGLVEQLRASGCVFAEEEADLLLEAGRDAGHLAELVRQRVDGRPLEQVLGWVGFAGLRIGVREGVFVPRRRTELMASEVVRLLRTGSDPRLVDLCCGVAPVSTVVLSAVPDAHVVATDIDPRATAGALANLVRWPQARVVTGDLFAAVPTRWRGRVDVVAANAPYVPTRDLVTMPREARVHEPALALDGGEDGLDVHRRIAAQAEGWLRPGGHLVAELAPAQVEAAREMFAAHSMTVRIVRDDRLGALVAVAESVPSPRPHRLGP